MKDTIIKAAICNYFLQMPTYEKRTELYDGREHVVVPVVMMVEGVHNGSHGPLLHTKEELGRIPDAWNGRPLVINHPQDEQGTYISANSPTVLASCAVGHVFNARMKGPKLVAEAWIDPIRLLAINVDAANAINEGEVMEVSIGVFTDQIEEEGVWKNVAYEGIAINFRPDHLALLPGGTGACSLASGCGIRANSKQNKNKKGENNEMLNLTGITEAFKSSPASEAILALEDQGISVEQFTANENLSARLDNVYAAINAMDTDTEYFYAVEIHDAFVIYRKRDRTAGTSSHFKQMYQVAADGSIEWVGAPTQVIEKVTYTPVSEPTNNVVSKPKMIRNKNKNPKEETTMKKVDCPACVIKVNALIADTKNPWTEDDREVLEVMNEEQLDRYAPTKPEAPIVNVKKDDEVLKVKITKDEALEALGPEFVQQMNFGLSVFADQKKLVVDHIIANTTEGVWKEDALNAMEYPTLKNIADSIPAKQAIAEAAQNNYVAFGTPKTLQVNESELEVMVMPGGEEDKPEDK